MTLPQNRSAAADEAFTNPPTHTPLCYDLNSYSRPILTRRGESAWQYGCVEDLRRSGDMVEIIIMNRLCQFRISIYVVLSVSVIVLRPHR